MGDVASTFLKSANNEIIETSIFRELTANGTFSLVPTGNTVAWCEIAILDPSTSVDATVELQEADGTRICKVYAANQGGFRLRIGRIQRTDNTAPTKLNGLKVVLANCTGTFSVAISWLGGW